MENKIEAYLDAFHTISVLVSKSLIREKITTFTLKGNEETISLSVTDVKESKDRIKYTTKFEGFVFLTENYYVLTPEGHAAELYSGSIVRSETFDELYAYDGDDLGVTYQKSETTFKLWSPIVKRITVSLTSPEGEKTRRNLVYHNQGIWSLTLSGDYEGYGYCYESYVNGKVRSFNDPYAIASTANGQQNVVVDPDKFVKMPNTFQRASSPAVDAIIYETSVRDFTKDASIDATHPGRFSSFIEEGLRTSKGELAGFDYLKDLGVTHVQILPFYDFEGVDETLVDQAYNWGYNPSQYNVVEGSLSTEPHNPYARINELRTMIDTLHKHNLSVVMDVVYNHVFDINTFPFDSLIPGYAYRVNDHGYLSESSGCGNDLATERTMIRNFIVDSVLYWAKMFNVDGFRFDLMGLIDIKTMHVLRQKLESFRKDMIVYGEGWNMPTPLKQDRLTHLQNNYVLYNIGFFNDITREYIKGSNFDFNDKGFSQGRKGRHKTIEIILKGGTVSHGAIKYPAQSLNYVECHDDYTYFDQTLKAFPNLSETTRLKMQRLATAMILLSQGVPFIHSGQEFFRTKNGVKNSYSSPDSINKLDWTRKDTYKTYVEEFKTLLEFRKNHPALRIKTPHEIENRVNVSFTENHTCIYTIQGENETDEILTIIFKNTLKNETIALESLNSLLFKSEDSIDLNEGVLTINTISTTILSSKRKDV